MKILVTGAAGFVGKAIVTELLQKKFDVYCLASLKTENKSSSQLIEIITIAPIKYDQ